MSIYNSNPSIASVSLNPSEGYVGTQFSVTTAGEVDVATKSYNWLMLIGATWVDIPGTGNSPNWVADISGVQIKCVVTASNFYSSVQFTSGTAVIDATPSADVLPMINSGYITPGTGGAGTVFTCQAVVFGYPVPTVTYQWKVSDGLGGYINVGTGQTYTLGSAYSADQLYCDIVATNRAGSVKWTAGGIISGAPLGPENWLTDSPVGNPIGVSFGTKNIVYPTDHLDPGYKTYMAKINLRNCTDTVAAGIFFNADSTFTSANNTVFVEVVKYKNSNAKQRYGLLISTQKQGETAGSLNNIIGFADITSRINNIQKNLPKVLQPSSISGTVTYTQIVNEIIQLKVVHYVEDPSLGNTDGSNPEVIRVYLNDREVTRWRTINPATGEIMKYPLKNYNFYNPSYQNWDKHLPRKMVLPLTTSTGTLFGVFASAWSQYSWCVPLKNHDGDITSYDFTQGTTNQTPEFLELYATEEALVGENENYYHRTQQYLTDIVLNKQLDARVQSYLMETNPSITGMNFYDVQYTIPAATNVDVLPISYLQYYVPKGSLDENKPLESITVEDTALVYSTPINTGFRGRMLIQNNLPHLVFLKKEPDSKNLIDVKLNLWTHNVVATSDQEVIETVIDKTNPSETIQVDSEWLQSEYAARKVMSTISAGVEKFSTDISLTIFGNPLIQVGDLVNLTYSLKEIKDSLYIVQSVQHSFTTGLETTLVLNKIKSGATYTDPPVYTITDLEILP